MKRGLDFICIGAAKSATTTLFDLIKDHPEIYIPESKEAAFFNNDEYWKKGFNWYLDSFFSDANSSQKIGTITPQYMSGAATRRSADEAIKVIAERIKKTSPDIKIIVMLRHPIERMFSHHKMRIREAYTKKTFEEDVARIMNDIKNEQKLITANNSYFFNSEYGRILSHYYKEFPKKNIHVIFTDDLKDDAPGNLVKVFKFLGVDSDFAPDNPTRKSHVGGGKPKITFLAPGYLQRFRVIKFLWSYLPPKLRKFLYFKVSFWNVKPDDNKLSKETKEYSQLVKYFSKDIKKLEKLVGRKTPWKEWK
jgi:hypothetical protein